MNYESVTRTNYFRVRAPDAFRDFMARVVTDGNSLSVWERSVSAGVTLFGFGCYGGIDGVQYPADSEDDSYDGLSFDDFVDQLATYIQEGDAAIIFEVGHEGLRYFSAFATIVAPDCPSYTVDLTGDVIDRAREILGDSDWHTVCEY